MNRTRACSMELLVVGGAGSRTSVSSSLSVEGRTHWSGSSSLDFSQDYSCLAQAAPPPWLTSCLVDFCFIPFAPASNLRIQRPTLSVRCRPPPPPWGWLRRSLGSTEDLRVGVIQGRGQRGTGHIWEDFLPSQETAHPWGALPHFLEPETASWWQWSSWFPQKEGECPVQAVVCPFAFIELVFLHPPSLCPHRASTESCSCFC